MADAARLVFLDTWTFHILLLISRKEPSRRSVLYAIQRNIREIPLCPAHIEKGKGKLDSHLWFLLLPDVGAGKISGRD